MQVTICHLPRAGDEVKAQLRCAVDRGAMNPAVRDRLSHDVSIVMRALGQVPNMDRPVTVQLHVHEECGMVCLRPVKAGAHMLAAVHIAYATDAFESLHVQCSSNNQEVENTPKRSRRPTHCVARKADHETLDSTGTGCTGEGCQPPVKVPHMCNFWR